MASGSFCRDRRIFRVYVRFHVAALQGFTYVRLFRVVGWVVTILSLSELFWMDSNDAV